MRATVFALALGFFAAVVNASGGGTISGRVLAADGTPLAGETVSLVDTSLCPGITCVPQSFLNDALTDASGFYQFMNVPDGTYFLDAYGDPGNRYLDIWWPDVWDTDFHQGLGHGPAPITIKNGSAAVADFRIDRGGHVIVSLRDASGAPILLPPTQNPRGVVIGAPRWGKMWVDANGGKYTVNGAAVGGRDLGGGNYESYALAMGRTYYVAASPAGSSYLTVYYDGKPTLESATPIPVNGDVPITIKLTATGPSISGKFSFATQQDAIVGSTITLYTADGTPIQTVNGNADGSYSLGGIPNGDYIIGIVASARKTGLVKNYTKFYRNGADIKSATIIPVRGASVTGIDIVMDTPADATPLRVLSFTATPPLVRAGQSATLSWSTQGATTVMIDNGVGTVAASGSITVTPSSKTMYTISALQGSSTITATATVDVLTAPAVNVTTFPAAMVQAAGSAGASTTYALTNSGGTATTINIGQTGNFFNQQPASLTLNPGATQIVTITATAQTAGTYDGASIPTGAGVPAGLQIPVRLLSAAPPTGSVTADPGSARVDVAAASNANPTGSVTFTNRGTSTLTGILASDAPWIIPQKDPVTIAPGQTVTLTFQIDRTKRPDATALLGSAEGTLTLTFLSGTGLGKRALDGTTPIPSVTIVKVVDTVQSPVSVAGIPVLAPNELGLVIPGVGHKVGTGGALFISDVSILNPLGNKSIDDVKMYYTSSAGNATSSKTTSLPSVPGQVSVAVADVVKSIFSGDDEVGTLHIRSKDADKLAVAATVLTANNATGTFGNTIPVFRSDRGVDTSGTIVLTGLRKDATTHTNLYIQEIGGAAATLTIDFLANDGSVVSSRSYSIDPFKLLQLVNVVPPNSLAAIVTNTSTAGGKLVAYATPVDEASNDTWAIADWSRQLGYPSTGEVVIPVGGTVHGANGTFYRTDMTITNRGADYAAGTLRYISRTGDKIDRQISLGSHQSDVISDVVGSRFNVSGDSVGFFLFTPATGSFALSSRTFTTVAGKPNTFGTGVPAIASASALTAGAARPIAGLNDASRSTVVASRPGTFRTNFALMETKGQPVTVRVTFRFTFPAGEKAQGIGGASRDYALNGNGFILLNSIAGEILGAARLQYGDLSNVEADFQVISGNGAVVLFTSSVDNATGDSILRTE